MTSIHHIYPNWPRSGSQSGWTEGAGVGHAPVAALLQLYPDRRGGLPPIGWTLPVAELAHRALVRLAGKGRPVTAPELTGRDPVTDQPLDAGHSHAHVLPLDIDDDNLLDHLLIHAPAGLGQVARRSITTLSVLRIAWHHVLAHPPGDTLECNRLFQLPHLRLPVRTRSFIESFADSSDEARSREMVGPHEVTTACRRAFRGCREWISLTPFVPPRYLKRGGKNGLLGQVCAELRSRGLPPAEQCEVLGRWTPMENRFHLSRMPGKPAPPQQLGFALRLRLPHPVIGPIALGYASHYGLGLFGAID